MGLDLAEPDFATACFVEWEEYPRSVLIAAQQAGYFAPAPIWDNVKTFDGRPWRGIIDTILAGYPCQPFSSAGQRKGDKDPRHLWPDVARIIDQVQPEWCFLENVPGHVTLGLETVLRTLWTMGYTPAVGLFSAAEIGAPHERLRVFIVAHRNSIQPGTDSGKPHPRANRGHNAGGGSGTDVADSTSTGSAQWRSAEQPARHAQGGTRMVAESERCGGTDVDNPASPRCDSTRGRAGAERESGQCLSGHGCDAVDNAGGIGWHAGGHGNHTGHVRQQPDTERGPMADPKRDAGHERGCRLGGDSAPRNAWQTNWPSAPQPSIFPPGPSDAAAWADTLAIAPDLAPAAGLADCLAWARRLAQTLGQPGQGAAESRLCGMADGLAARSRQLRLLGNGVVPLAAAYAWRTLAAAHGLRPVDLETTSGKDSTDAV